MVYLFLWTLSTVDLVHTRKTNHLQKLSLLWTSFYCWFKLTSCVRSTTKINIFLYQTHWYFVPCQIGIATLFAFISWAFWQLSSKAHLDATCKRVLDTTSFSSILDRVQFIYLLVCIVQSLSKKSFEYSELTVSRFRKTSQSDTFYQWPNGWAKIAQTQAFERSERCCIGSLIKSVVESAQPLFFWVLNCKSVSAIFDIFLIVPSFIYESFSVLHLALFIDYANGCLVGHTCILFSFTSSWNRWCLGIIIYRRMDHILYWCCQHRITVGPAFLED